MSEHNDIPVQDAPTADDPLCSSITNQVTGAHLLTPEQRRELAITQAHNGGYLDPMLNRSANGSGGMGLREVSGEQVLAGDMHVEVCPSQTGQLVPTPAPDISIKRDGIGRDGL